MLNTCSMTGKSILCLYKIQYLKGHVIRIQERSMLGFVRVYEGAALERENA
jgi:hypothetical protein